MTLVKICGLRSLPESRVALQAGANFLRFIFWKQGKRYTPPSAPAQIIATLRSESLDWSAVGVFVDPVLDEVQEAATLCGLDYVQLSGHEPAEQVAAMPRPVFKALHVKVGHESAAADLVDSNALGA